MKHILKCPQCGKYTLKAGCSSCGIGTEQARPPKYSPGDPYGEYRRAAKKDSHEQQGFI
ncbi:RNA-protein complex protein Nop10 [Candidatus Woesearchaeota archaeon]|nr:RNA-protein complex protein Nop10 [Candidatus Woesearchaeota archaeon]